MELCQNIVLSGLRHRPSVRYVAMETTQLVLNQFKNFLTLWIQNWIRSLFGTQITSKRCELVKLCHINRSCPVFWDTVYIVDLPALRTITFCTGMGSPASGRVHTGTGMDSPVSGRVHIGTGMDSPLAVESILAQEWTRPHGQCAGLRPSLLVYLQCAGLRPAWLACLRPSQWHETDEMKT